MYTDVSGPAAGRTRMSEDFMYQFVGSTEGVAARASARARPRIRNARGTAIKKALRACLLLLAVSASQVFAHGEMRAMHQAPMHVTEEQHEWGVTGDPAHVTRTVTVSMSDDMRFTPAAVDVRLGETVRFVLKNSGRLMHEFVLGTGGVLNKHAALMAKFPGMEHDEPYMAHVAPGKTGELVWTFNRPGQFDFACLILGHYQAGMKGRVHVVAK